MTTAERIKERAGRCPWAIKFGTTLHTRCWLLAGHDRMHEGRGLEQFSYQLVSWLPGDRRQYETDRVDEFAWEEAQP